jgi:hypothetical protein
VSDGNRFDPLIGHWIEWLEGDLYQSVTALVYQMHTYRSFNEMMSYAAEESKSNGWIHQWIRLNYRDALLAALRRQGTSGSDERSLSRFLRDVEVNAQILTKEWKEGDARNEYERLRLLGQWGELSVESGDHVDPGVVRQDIERLDGALHDVKEWATHHVAHLLLPEKRDEVESITYEDMHDAVGVIWHLYQRWRLILTATDVMYPDPVWWEDVFTVQWIDGEDAHNLFEARSAEANEVSGRLPAVDPRGPNDSDDSPDDSHL